MEYGGWSIEFLKLQDNDPIEVWYNELIVKSHPNYTNVNEYVKVPKTQGFMPAFGIIIDNGLKKIAIAYATYYYDGADEWYRVPIPGWRSEETRLWLVTLDTKIEGGVEKLNPKGIYRVWKYDNPLNNGATLVYFDNLEYKGISPGIVIFDENMKVKYEVKATIAPIVAAVIVGLAASGAAVGVSYFWSKGKEAEARVAEANAQASIAKVEQTRIIADTVKELYNKASNCNAPPDYCLALTRGAMDAVGGLMPEADIRVNVSDTPSENDSGLQDWLKENAIKIGSIAGLIGIIFLMFRLGIIKWIMEEMRDLFRRGRE